MIIYSTDNFTTTPVSQYILYAAGPNAAGETFYSNGVTAIGYIDVWIRKTGSPTGTFSTQIAGLQNTPGVNAIPAGSILSSGSVYNVASAPTTWTAVRLVHNAVLPQGYYTFWVNYSTGGDISNRLEVGNNPNNNASNNAIFFVGGSWSGTDVDDTKFRLVVDDVVAKDITGSAYIETAGPSSMPVNGIVGGWGSSTIGAQAAGEVLRPASTTVDQTITGNASITQVVTKTITGNARITAITTRTITGNARITVLTSRTITGNARITALTTRTIIGNARIQKTVDRTISGNARITQVVDRTITGNANLLSSLIATDQTIIGNARIQATIDRIITGNASIRKTVDRTIVGNARIQKTVDRTIIGNARITALTSRTITGNARITATTTRTITGNARIQFTRDQTIIGNARISILTTRTIVGNARIAKNVDQTITGNARIANLTDRNITGNARIVLVIDRTIIGNARIKKYTDPERPTTNTSQDQSFANIIVERVDIQIYDEKPKFSTPDYKSAPQINSDDKPTFR